MKLSAESEKVLKVSIDYVLILQKLLDSLLIYLQITAYVDLVKSLLLLYNFIAKLQLTKYSKSVSYTHLDVYKRQV